MQAEAASARTAAEAAEKRAEVRWRWLAVQCSCAPVCLLDTTRPWAWLVAVWRDACVCSFVVQEQGKRAAEAEAAQKRMEVCVRGGGPCSV